jgi:hypothetical protein
MVFLIILLDQLKDSPYVEAILRKAGVLEEADHVSGSRVLLEANNLY